MQSNKQRGQKAEFLARLWFRLHGFGILYKNYVTGRGTTAGEVDFIAKRGKLIVFVEVKERKNLETALYAISPQQQKRLLNAARYFLQKHPQYENFDIRFDAVFVALPFKLKHIKNAWQTF